MFKDILLKLKLDSRRFEFRHSPGNKDLESYIEEIDLKKDIKFIQENFDIVFSLHCIQLFPSELVKKIKCINIHPGYNPFNRGWYPHVFSIINKLPAGVTIHEMDEKIDHGHIIDQRELKIESFDTSSTLYKRLLKLEEKLIKKNLKKILDGKYKTHTPDEGNVNLKKDFDSICALDLNKIRSAGELIDILRALTHEPYKNAYFFDRSGNKIYISIKLKKENGNKIP